MASECLFEWTFFVGYNFIKEIVSDHLLREASVWITYFQMVQEGELLECLFKPMCKMVNFISDVLTIPLLILSFC